ncbi:WD repeat-containing protein 91 isoform X2 [Lycorma delicatula]|uniref:WD repeat-containing protein 91 isoform X2 n=1 Tax=Lycorma delicatula TaxID=130591 RepID=UPI003F50EC70
MLLGYVKHLCLILSEVYCLKMSHIQLIDELIREYFVFRGFMNTLKSFDSELKTDKDKSFRVDKIIDQLVQFIYSYDLSSLRELWSHLDGKIFSKLDHEFTAVLPFVKNAEECSTFAVHFTRPWQDTLLVSLHNFLAIVFQAMSLPVLARYEEAALRMKQLQDENDMLKQRLAVLQQKDQTPIGPEAPSTPDIMDDFYSIAQETPVSGKSLKDFIKSPIMGRKPACPSSQGEPGQKRYSMKQRLSSTPTATGAWIKAALNSSEGGTASKRSVSLEARSRGTRSGSGSGRDNSLDNLDRRNVKVPSRQDTFLLLSQEEMLEHRSSITQCKFTPSGSVVASADVDGVIKVWSPAPNPKLLATTTCKSSVLSLDWVAKNERFFVSGSRQGAVCLHDTDENKIIWEASTDRNYKVVSLSCSPTEPTFVCACTTGQNQGKLLLYDMKTRKMERSLSVGLGGPNLVVNCCTYNHNGQLLVVGCSDGTVRTVDIRNSECVGSWSAHLGAVLCLQLTPDHNSCYSFGMDGKLCRHSLTQRGIPAWEATLTDIPIGSNAILASSPLSQAFCLDQSGNHALICCAHSGANIYQITNTGLNNVLQLGGHCNVATVACDWTNANQCGTCITASVDGNICVSTLLMP